MFEERINIICKCIVSSRKYVYLQTKQQCMKFFLKIKSHSIVYFTLFKSNIPHIIHMLANFVSFFPFLHQYICIILLFFFILAYVQHGFHESLFHFPPLYKQNLFSFFWFRIVFRIHLLTGFNENTSKQTKHLIFSAFVK